MLTQSDKGNSQTKWMRCAFWMPQWNRSGEQEKLAIDGNVFARVSENRKLQWIIQGPFPSKKQIAWRCSQVMRLQCEQKKSKGKEEACTDSVEYNPFSSPSYHPPPILKT